MFISFITNDDDIDFGIIPNDMSIQYNQDTELKQGEIINPFFVGIKGGNIKQLSWGDLHRNYNSVIIITLSINYNEINLDNFFKEIITENDIQNNGLTYFRTSLNILKNKDHYFRTNIVSKNYLNKLFPSGEFNESEVVLSIFEMNEENLEKFYEKFFENLEKICHAETLEACRNPGFKTIEQNLGNQKFFEENFVAIFFRVLVVKSLLEIPEIKKFQNYAGKGFRDFTSILSVLSCDVKKLENLFAQNRNKILKIFNSLQ